MMFKKGSFFLFPAVAHWLWPLLLWVGLLPGAAYSGDAEAPFVIAVAAQPTSMDPHAARTTPDLQLALTVFDTLFQRGSGGGLQSRVLSSWKNLDGREWELQLKPGLKFHDGSPFTSRDVVYTFDRLRQLGSNDYTPFANGLDSYQALDGRTVRISTKKANPLFPLELSGVSILPSRDHFVDTEHFEEDQRVIGSGAYIYKGKSKSGGILLDANLNYHGTVPHLKHVELRFIEKAEDRVAALKRGEVQFVEQAPPQAIRELEGLPNLDLINTVSFLLMELMMDSHREVTPFITDKEGRALKANPLKDWRVRKALSLAIDRDVLVREVLNGVGEPSGQFLPPGFTGSTPVLRPDPYSSEQARQLLAEAGYPDGFRLSLHGADGFFMNDKEILKKIASMLGGVGIETTPVALGKDELFAGSADSRYSVVLMGIFSDGNLAIMLKNTIHTKNDHFGIFNDGRFSNSEIDRLIEGALNDFNDLRRVKTLIEASELAINEMAVVPLYFENFLSAFRNDLGVEYWSESFDMVLPESFKKVNNVNGLGM